MDPNNWSENMVPAMVDHAVISTAAPVAVNLNQQWVVRDLTLDTPLGGITSLAGHLTVVEDFLWLDGDFTGFGELVLWGNTHILTDANHILDGWVMRNGGVMYWEGPVELSSGSLLINELGATIFNPTNTVLDEGIGAIGGECFINNGVFLKTGETPNGALTETYFDVKFDNHGLVDVSVGRFEMWEGGTHHGVFEADPGARVKFVHGTHYLNTGARFRGAGLVKVEAPIDEEVRLVLPHGAVVYNEGHFELARRAFLQGTGAGSGAGEFHNMNQFKWVAGTILNMVFITGETMQPGPGLENLPPPIIPVMEINRGGAGDAWILAFESSLLKNYGIVNWKNGDINLRTNYGDATIRNFATFNAESDHKMEAGTGAMGARKFINEKDMQTGTEGVFSKVGGAGGATEFGLNVLFVNNGKVKKNGRQVTFTGGLEGTGTVEN